MTWATAIKADLEPPLNFFMLNGVLACPMAVRYADNVGLFTAYMRVLVAASGVTTNAIPRNVEISNPL